MSFIRSTVLLAVAAVAFVAFLSGMSVQSGIMKTAVDQRSAREQRILTWIVETNPQASIKDFVDFPRHLIEVTSARGLDYRLLLAMAAHESEMRPDAVGAHGEIGLFQIMPKTAALVVAGLKIDFKPPVRGTARAYSDLGSLGDPKVNALIAAEYFKDQVARFGQTPIALQAYNRGGARAREIRPHDNYAAAIAKTYLVIAAERRL